MDTANILIESQTGEFRDAARFVDQISIGFGSWRLSDFGSRSRLWRQSYFSQLCLLLLQQRFARPARHQLGVSITRQRDRRIKKHLTAHSGDGISAVLFMVLAAKDMGLFRLRRGRGRAGLD